MNPERWQRIKEVAFGAMELQEGQRSQFLDKECGSDSDLRRAAEALVDEDQRNGGTIERGIASVAAGVQPKLKAGESDTMLGRTVSHYKITEKLGEGGMGEVWKAEDTQLRRTVALKFLSSETVGDEEVRARLIREAQASASLDHPNICQVFGIHEERGETFIAMAYIDGPSLADRIKERPLPLDEALGIAVQIAEGLQEAHEKGIIHRDIKPGNIMLTAKGQVKIMDFGLAAVSGRSRLTKTGTTLGTPAYMSPEQLEGREVDRRADIWALGVVLYEIFTQRTPFAADYEQAIAYGVLNEEPEPITALRSGLPTEIDRVIARALSKDRDERYQHVDEMIVVLNGLNRKPAPGKSDIPTAETGKPWQSRAGLAERIGGREKLAWVTSAVFCVGMITVSVIHLGEVQQDVPFRRFDILRDGTLDLSGSRTHAVAAISPNGRHVAFVEAGAKGKLWVQDLDQSEPRSIDGTEGVQVPFWAPGSDFIGFSANSGIKKVSVQGGSPVLICSKSGTGGASWSADGEVIVFAAGIPSELYQVPARGGQPRLLISMQELQDSLGEQVDYVSRPYFLPSEAGGQTMVFNFGGPDREKMVVENLETGSRELIGPGDFPSYSSTGHLLHQPSFGVDQIWALPFSLDTLVPHTNVCTAWGLWVKAGSGRGCEFGLGSAAI